jgi:hypothetical protein
MWNGSLSALKWNKEEGDAHPFLPHIMKNVTLLTMTSQALLRMNPIHLFQY